MMKGQQRSFNSRWYADYPFIEYSVQNDAVYCFPCRFFPSSSHKAETTFTVKGMRDWKKIRCKLEKHSHSDCHKHSMSLWAGYKQARIHGSVSDHLSSERAKTIQENRQYLKSICQVAVLCARQDIGLRGHREHEGSSNKGNFLEILDLVASENSFLKKRMQDAPQNAKYVSKSTQNELLHAAAKVIIEGITDEIKRAHFFSLIADETRDVSRVEQLSLCFRYVHPEDHTVKERFLGFTDCSQLDAVALATQIIGEVVQLGLNIKDCVAQCYDGAAVMSGHLSGVQSRIRERVGSGCVYIHCYAHRLNLVVVNTASSIKAVNDFFGLLEAVYRFVTASSLRHDKFVECQKKHKLKVMEIPKISDTRWVCRYAAVRLFKERYKSLIQAFEAIVNNSHDGCERAEAIGLVTQLQNFQFIVLLWVFSDILGVTKSLSDTLQSKDIDLATAIDLVESVEKTLTERRTRDYFHQKIWLCALKDAEDNNVEISSTQEKRRSAVPSRLEEALILAPLGRRLQHNVAAQTTNQVLFYSIVDKILAEFHRRFDESREIVLAVAACSPKSKHFFEVAAIKPLAEECSLDLSTLEPQLAVARNLIVQQSLQTMEDVYSLLSSMQTAFPDVFTLVRAALTIPVSSASAERSFSALKRIKTYLRSTMCEDRLTHLSIISIERDISKYLDYDKVIDKFASVSRRITLM